MGDRDREFGVSGWDLAWDGELELLRLQQRRFERAVLISDGLMTIDGFKGGINMDGLLLQLRYAVLGDCRGCSLIFATDKKYGRLVAILIALTTLRHSCPSDTVDRRPLPVIHH